MNLDTLTRLKRQDPRAQKELYYQHCDRLMLIVRRYIKNTIDAEEVLQDAFMNIYTKIDHYNPELGVFEAWSARLTINNALKFYRKKKSIQYSDRDINEVNVYISNNGLDNLEAEDVYEKINKLDEKYRTIFLLKGVEGYSHKEIGELLGIQEISSRKLYSRARKKLQEFFFLNSGAQINAPTKG